MLSVNIHSVVLSCMTVCLLWCVMSLRCVNGWIKTVLLLLLLFMGPPAQSRRPGN